MSFVRNHMQQIARFININIPLKFGFINSNFINDYQRIHDATAELKKKQSLPDPNFNKKEKFPFYKKLLGLLTMSVYVGSRCKQLNDDNFFPPAISALNETDAKYNSNANKTTSEEIDPDKTQNSEDEYGENKTTTTEKRMAYEQRSTFSERAVIEYENRLRSHSTPEKVFRYFATICLVTDRGTEIVMTPNDFLRAIYPGKKQPRELGLDRFRRIRRSEIGSLDFHLQPDSIFLKLGFNGLISYSDFLFLMTLLTTSSRHFEIAFKMFDLNGDGILTATEFESVTSLTRQSATFSPTGLGKNRRTVTNAVMYYFFGRDGRGSLSIEKFLQFQRDFKREIITLEFESKPRNEYGLISESDFAELLIAYAGYSVKQKEEKLRRVRKRFKYQRGLSKKDYLDFWELLNNLTDVEMALSYYFLVGATVDKATFNHIARSVTKVNLSEHVVNVAFTLFDDNYDDHLNRSEFVDVMKRRLHRGMETKRGSNLSEIMKALKKCALERRVFEF